MLSGWCPSKCAGGSNHWVEWEGWGGGWVGGAGRVDGRGGGETSAFFRMRWWVQSLGEGDGWGWGWGVSHEHPVIIQEEAAGICRVAGALPDALVGPVIGRVGG